MLRYLRPKQMQLKLGRWSAINIENKNCKKDIEKQIETNVNWANHDHCGSELCRLKGDESNNDKKKSLNEISDVEMLAYIYY